MTAVECDVISLAPEIKKYFWYPSSERLENLKKNPIIKRFHASSTYLEVTGYDNANTEFVLYAILLAIIALYSGIIKWLGY